MDREKESEEKKGEREGADEERGMRVRQPCPLLRTTRLFLIPLYTLTHSLSHSLFRVAVCSTACSARWMDGSGGPTPSDTSPIKTRRAQTAYGVDNGIVALQQCTSHVEACLCSAMKITLSASLFTSHGAVTRVRHLRLFFSRQKIASGGIACQNGVHPVCKS